MLKEYKWTCKICGLIIRSPYKHQFEYNKDQHEQKHKRKMKVQEELQFK